MTVRPTYRSWPAFHVTHRLCFSDWTWHIGTGAVLDNVNHEETPQQWESFLGREYSMREYSMRAPVCVWAPLFLSVGPWPSHLTRWVCKMWAITPPFMTLLTSEGWCQLSVVIEMISFVPSRSVVLFNPRPGSGWLGLSWSVFGSFQDL